MATGRFAARHLGSLTTYLPFELVDAVLHEHRAVQRRLRDLRRRVGCAPMRALFKAVAGALARPHAPGVGFGTYRTVPFEGCGSIKVPDSERNQRWLGAVRTAVTSRSS
ncbi:hypothetical protein [Streptomyces sp. NPDC055400]